MVREEQIFYFGKSESEFLKRELGWRYLNLALLNPQTINSLLETGAEVVLSVGNSVFELDYIKSFKLKEKVWVLLYADETFNPWLNRAVLNCSNVKGVLRAYPIPKINLIEQLLRATRINIEYLIDSSKSNFLLFVKMLFFAYAFAIRQGFVRLLEKKSDKRIIDFIPGYTNLFASTFMSLFRERSERNVSLLSRLTLEESPLPKKEIGFVGQIGSEWRNHAISNALLTLEDRNAIELIVRNKFGGTLGSNGANNRTALEYINTTMNSRFTLCPPGNFSYSTFRFLESIICGSIPILVVPKSYDPFYDIPFGNSPTFWNKDWKTAVKFATKMSIFESQELIRKLKSDASLYFKSVNDLLLQ